DWPALQFSDWAKSKCCNDWATAEKVEASGVHDSKHGDARAERPPFGVQQLVEVRDAQANLGARRGGEIPVIGIDQCRVAALKEGSQEGVAGLGHNFPR